MAAKVGQQQILLLTLKQTWVICIKGQNIYPFVPTSKGPATATIPAPTEAQGLFSPHVPKRTGRDEIMALPRMCSSEEALAFILKSSEAYMHLVGSRKFGKELFHPEEQTVSMHLPQPRLFPKKA
ncbi:unnamed protein product [Natator depressus]